MSDILNIDLIVKALSFVSLGLSPLVIILCIIVVKEWKSEIAKISFFRKKTSIEWFILGVVFGFVGNCVDNLFWMIPWSHHYIFDTARLSFPEAGVCINVFFRQFLTFLAAYCHIRAAIEHSPGEFLKKVKKLNKITVFSLVLGVIYCVCLYLYKHYTI